MLVPVLKDSGACKDITGHPEFIALSLLHGGGPASVATELESLLYCFLWYATRDRLHWKHARRGTPSEVDSKAAVMHTERLFEDKVIARIEDRRLHKPARALRLLFIASWPPRVTPAAWKAALQL